MPGLKTGLLMIVAAGLTFWWFGQSGRAIPRLFAWGLPALLIVGGALSVEIAGALPRSEALRAIGDSSYSIYLTHSFVVASISKLTGPLANSWLYVWSVVVLSAIAGYITYLIIERPIIRLSKFSPREIREKSRLIMGE
jgi:exopolysaccharide production protein ExoZ